MRCLRLSERWQSSLLTKPWPINWRAPVRNESNANFDKRRSGKRCIESISKSCKGKNRPDCQSFPSPKINCWEKTAHEYRLQIHPPKRGTSALDFSAREEPAVSGSGARPTHDLHSSQPIIERAVSCLGITESGQSWADRRPWYGFLHQSVRRARRDRGHASHRAGSRRRLEQRERERL